MIKLKQGDRVEIHFKDGIAASPYSDKYDDSKTLEIIGVDSCGYYLYIPHHIYVTHKNEISSYIFKKFSINEKFKDADYLYIDESFIFETKYILDGQICKNCKYFCNQAEPNQEDGSFKCFSCRINPYR